MKRKQIALGLLIAVSSILMVILIAGSFVTYAQPISSTAIQNIYIGRIINFGVPILVLQLAALIIVLLDRKAG